MYLTIAHIYKYSILDYDRSDEFIDLLMCTFFRKLSFIINYVITVNHNNSSFEICTIFLFLKEGLVIYIFSTTPYKVLQK